MPAESAPRITLIAARGRGRAEWVARKRRWNDGHWRLLSYETHQAFPDADLFVDPTWADAPNASTIEALVARRLTIAAGQRLGPASRQTIARAGV